MFNIFKKREKSGRELYNSGEYRKGLDKLKREKNNTLLAGDVLPDLINRGRLPEAEEITKFLGIKLNNEDYYNLGQNALKLHQEKGNGYSGFAETAFKKIDLKFLSQKIREDNKNIGFLEDYKKAVDVFSTSVHALSAQEIDYQEYVEQIKDIDRILTKYSSNPIYRIFLERTGENNEFLSPKLDYDTYDNSDPEKKYALPLGASTGLIEDMFDYYISYGKGEKLEKRVSPQIKNTEERQKVYTFSYNLTEN